MLYKAYIRPILEYSVTTWSPHLRRHEIQIEAIQRRATKIIPSIAHLSYTERLKFLKLDTLFYRRRRGDLLQVYRIMNQVDRLDFNTFFELNTYNTRGNTKKICKPRANSTIKQNSFNHRVINDWNNLSNDIVCAESINSFKTLLDKFWQSKNFKYEFVFYS